MLALLLLVLSCSWTSSFEVACSNDGGGFFSSEVFFLLPQAERLILEMRLHCFFPSSSFFLTCGGYAKVV